MSIFEREYLCIPLETREECPELRRLTNERNYYFDLVKSDVDRWGKASEWLRERYSLASKRLREFKRDYPDSWIDKRNTHA